MSLYPITTIDTVTASQGPNIILSGSEVIIPIDMSSVRMTQLSLFQMSDTQDFSLRAWLSQEQDGDVLPATGFVNSNYAVPRFGGLPIIIYIAGETPPANTFPIEVTPGFVYFLNILNLTNKKNLFGFTKTDLA